MSIKDVGVTLVRGSTYFIVAQVVTLFFDFLTSVLIARLLGESGYGLWGLTWSIFGIFTLLEGLPGTQHAIVRYVSKYSTEKKLGLTRSVILTSLKLQFLSIGLSCSVTVLLANYVANVLNHPELAILLTIFAVGHFTFALNLTGVFDALKKFHYTAGLSILGSALKFLAIAALLNMGYGIVGAAIGQALYSVVVSLLTFLFVITRFLPSKPQSNGDCENETSFISTSRKIFTYGLPLSLTMLIVGFDVNFRNLMLGNVNGLAILGYFTLAMTITTLISMPLQLVTIPLFPIISELETKGEREKIDELLAALFKNMVLFVATAVIFVELFAPQIVCLIYSEAFAHAAELLRMLVIIAVPAIFFNLSGTLLKGIGHSGLVLKINLISSLVVIPAYAILIPTFGVTGLIVVLVAASFGFNPFLWIYFSKKAIRKLPFQFKTLVRLVPTLGMVAVILFLARPIILQSELYLIVSSIVALLLTFTFSCLTGGITEGEIDLLKSCTPEFAQRWLDPIFSFLIRIAR